MLTSVQQMISRMKPFQRGFVDREKQMQTRIDAQRIQMLRSEIGRSSSAKNIIGEILERTGTKLEDWENPYKRRTIYRKGGVLRYV